MQKAKKTRQKADHDHLQELLKRIAGIELEWPTGVASATAAMWSIAALLEKERHGSSGIL